MERAFPVEEISDAYWASSSSSPRSGAASSNSKLMNRSPSEWAFQRFLQEAETDGPSASIVSTATACPRASDAAASKSSASSECRPRKGGKEDGMVEVRNLPAPPSLPPQASKVNAPVATPQCPEYLQKQLNIACAAAAALSRVRSGLLLPVMFKKLDLWFSVLFLLEKKMKNLVAHTGDVDFRKNDWY